MLSEVTMLKACRVNDTSPPQVTTNHNSGTFSTPGSHVNYYMPYLMMVLNFLKVQLLQ